VTRLVGEAFDRIRGIVVITEGLRSDWKAATETKIIVERDGVNLDRFDITAPKSDLRSELSLPPNHRIVSYVGSLQPWKGVDTLLKAAKGFPENTSACIVGGDQKERERLAAAVGEVPSNVRFVEHVPPGQVPLYLAASDVLVLPNSAEQRISAKYTSPLKLFEYMAAQRPIIASDIPSLREVLDEQMAFFVKPDDPGSLSEAVIHLAGECGADKAAVARREVERYTWKARAERITAEFGSTQANPEGEQCTS
jgi:glycosyltransferase involved in cell wall biosynthesis